MILVLYYCASIPKTGRAIAEIVNKKGTMHVDASVMMQSVTQSVKGNNISKEKTHTVLSYCSWLFE